jgi:biotin operon repressor
MGVMEFHIKMEGVDIMHTLYHSSHNLGVRMDRYRCFLMFIFIFCFLSGRNLTGVSTDVSQQASGNEDRVMDQKDQEKVTGSYGPRQVGKSVGMSDRYEKNFDTAPFSDERFAYRPTRAGGMPTILYPKGVPYSENTPLSARE